MTKWRKLSAGLLALFALAASGAALAHVGYGSSLYTGAGAYDPIANTIGTGAYGGAANFNSTVASNGGFIAGLDPYTLGNSHDVRFRYFVLSEASTVSFTVTGLANSPVSGNANPYLNGITPGTLNPAFSLYSGVVPASAHEGVGDIGNVATFPAVATYLTTASDFASWSPFAGVNAVRGGAAAGTPANPTGLWGVFDSDGNWTIGNNGQFTDTSNSATNPAQPPGANGPYLGSLGVPKIATATYLGISVADAAAGASFVDSLHNPDPHAVTGADGVVDNAVSWSGVLGPGVYTLAIGGAGLADYASLFSHVQSSSGGLDTTAMCGATTCVNLYAADRLARGVSITNFTVAAVPEPATVQMLVAGMLLLGAAGVRRVAARSGRCSADSRQGSD